MMQNRKIKIVYFSGFLGFGGSERQLYLLLSNLDKALFDVHVVVFNRSPNETYRAPLEESGVTVWQIPTEVKGIVARVRFLYGLLRKLKPDIIHSWTYHDNAYAGVVGRLAGVKVRWGSLRNSYYAREVQHLNKLFRWVSLWGIGRIVVNATAIADELVALKFPRERIHVLVNCVLPPDIDENTPLPDLTEFGINGSQQLIGIVGNLRYQKNHLMYVDSMNKVLPRHENALGVIVGQPLPLNPGVAEEINNRIAQYGLNERIIMTGFRGDVPNLMRRLNVLAMTSHYEGMPNAIMEAMAAGRPVVATRVGGVPDLIEHGVNGLIVEPDDVAGFAEAVSHLLNNPVEAEAMGQRSLDLIASKFSQDTVTAELMRFYQDAVE